MAESAGEVTRLLIAWSRGDEHAQEKLLALVYDELKLLASSFLSRERADHTLQPTDLVHEAYLRLVRGEPLTWANRAHFYGCAARSMRCILVDHARRRRYAKRGAGARRVDLGKALELPDARAPELIELDHALESLAAVAPRQARIVEMRFFAGMSREEIAVVLGVSVPTVIRQWRVARAWLYRSLAGGPEAR